MDTVELIKKSVTEQVMQKQQEYKVLPCNIDAEQALLGALMINNDAINSILEFLVADHFYEPVHQRIFDSIYKFHERGLIANPVTLKTYFDNDPALSDIGGAQYLVNLAVAAGPVFNVRDYGKTVYEMAMKRKLAEVGEEISLSAIDQKVDSTASAQIESAEQKLFNLAMQGSSERTYEPLRKSVYAALEKAEQAYKNPGGVTGTTTGFTDLDRILGGFQNSDLIILAGRPSMGKTALATNMALNACRALKAMSGDEKECGSVAFFSLEMSGEQLGSRLLSGASGINAGKLKRGELSPDEFTKLVQASRELSEIPFFIDDMPAISISALRTRARRMKRMHNLSLIVVDYLQLMRSTSEQAKTNRVLEISDITQGLKAIAKELNIPVIALSQLSRAVEQREEKRPLLSDLRESGTIEQDADVVLFVFREEYYLARSMPREGTPKFETWQREMEAVHGIAEVIVAKHRNGPIGTAKLQFQSDTTKFGNLSQDGYTPDDVYM